VADYGGVSLLHQHHGISHDAAESAALAFNAGLDALSCRKMTARGPQTPLSAG
jgi:hypothetical protein